MKAGKRTHAGAHDIKDVPHPEHGLEDEDTYATLVRQQLELLGEDAERNGLLRTPERVARSMRWLTRGYDLTVQDAIGDGVFDEDHRNMVVVKDIEMYSMCEHHMLPIAEAIWSVLEPEGVGVVCEALHLCMMMRGVEKQNSRTITSAMRGVFLEDMRTRDEFLRLTHVNGVVG